MKTFSGLPFSVHQNGWNVPAQLGGAPESRSEPAHGPKTPLIAVSGRCGRHGDRI